MGIDEFYAGIVVHYLHSVLIGFCLYVYVAVSYDDVQLDAAASVIVKIYVVISRVEALMLLEDVYKRQSLDMM